MSAIKPNTTTALALDSKAIAGVNKYFAKVKNITIAGTTYTPATLKAALQAEIDATTALDTSRAAINQQVATTRAARAKASAVRKGLRAYVLSTYGAQAVQVLGDFGMTAPKTGTKTALVKAEAVTKAQATRDANKPAGKQNPASPGLASGAAPATTEAITAPQSQVAAPAANVTHP